MRAAGRVAFLCLALGVGAAVGQHMASSPPPPPALARTIEVPKYIEHTTTVTKEVVPQACLDAIEAATQVQASIDAYEKHVGHLPDLIDDTYRAILTQDVKKLNELKTDQQKLEGDSIGDLVEIRAQLETLNRTQPKCQAAVR